jgi:hypothetical protein
MKRVRHVNRYTVRLSDAQRRLAETAAAEADVRLSEWLRDVLESAARRQLARLDGAA